MNTEREAKLQRLMKALPQLTDGQISWIDEIINQFTIPHSYNRYSSSDLINDCILQDFGDSLRLHHLFSAEPFSKDKFEYVLERVCRLCGVDAKRAKKGNPGHDITINSIKISLKTQADRDIKFDKIEIHKFMELGKGLWTDQPEQLEGLRQQYLNHMSRYERIFVLLLCEGFFWFTTVPVVF